MEHILFVVKKSSDPWVFTVYVKGVEEEHLQEDSANSAARCLKLPVFFKPSAVSLFLCKCEDVLRY